MRKLAALIACGAAATLLALPALGQTSSGERRQQPSASSRAGAEAGATQSDSTSPGPPLDRGPHAPEANQAHRGGGAVLEGAPGAPAPAPQPTPPRDAIPR